MGIDRLVIKIWGRFSFSFRAGEWNGYMDGLGSLVGLVGKKVVLFVLFLLLLWPSRGGGGFYGEGSLHAIYVKWAFVGPFLVCGWMRWWMERLAASYVDVSLFLTPPFTFPSLSLSHTLLSLSSTTPTTSCWNSTQHPAAIHQCWVSRLVGI